jgi:hypothetical protein
MLIKPLLDQFTFVRMTIAGKDRIRHSFKGDGAQHAVGARWEGVVVVVVLNELRHEEAV